MIEREKRSKQQGENKHYLFFKDSINDNEKNAIALHTTVKPTNLCLIRWDFDFQANVRYLCLGYRYYCYYGVSKQSSSGQRRKKMYRHPRDRQDLLISFFRPNRLRRNARVVEVLVCVLPHMRIWVVQIAVCFTFVLFLFPIWFLMIHFSAFVFFITHNNKSRICLRNTGIFDVVCGDNDGRSIRCPEYQ